jgi:hypothetical protein
MKKILTLALLLAGASLFAQTSTSTTTTQQSPATALSAKAKSLCKMWTLTMTENFGDQHKPTEEQKGDLFVMFEDGKYRLLMNGVGEGGTWALSKDNLWITLTSTTGAVKKFKILESTETSLKVDYRDADEVHNILIYSTSTGATKAK